MKLIDLARMIVTPVGAAILSKLGQLICPSTHKIQKYLRWLSQPLEARYRGVSSSDPKDKHRLLRKEFLNKIKNQEPQHSLTQWISEIFEANKTWPTLERLMDFDRKTFLANDLLIKADRMSMYSSLELRVPFLDPILMQYVINLPSHYKIHKGDPKRILKDAYPELPDNIRFREKTGFPTPLAQMFKSGPLLERTVAEFTADHPVFTILDFEACSLLLQNHINGKEDNHAALWRILVLALWVKKNCNVQQ